MLRSEALSIVGGIGATSKMPGPTYGLPIAECPVGRILRERQPDSTCHHCYAARYRPSVLEAQYRRLETVRAATADPAGAGNRWVSAWRVILRNVPHMRWHDAGDLQGPEHLELLTRVAGETPATQHWLPTRETQTVRRYLDAGGSVPVNLRIRISAALVGQPASGFPIHPQVTVSAVTRPGAELEGYSLCPASGPNKLRDHCGDCRRCWGSDPVAYVLH